MKEIIQYYCTIGVFAWADFGMKVFPNMSDVGASRILSKKWAVKNPVKMIWKFFGHK